MTTIQQSLSSAFEVLLTSGGVPLLASTGESVSAIIQDAPELADPTEMPLQKTPIYCRVAVKAGEVSSPRNVQSFTDAASKTFTVLRYVENVFGIKDEWICEKQRS